MVGDRYIKGGNKLKLIITEEEILQNTDHYLYRFTVPAVEAIVNWYLETGVEPKIDLLENQIIQQALNEADVLLYSCNTNMQRANEIFNALVGAIAVLAFIPYGVLIFGHRYEVVDGSKET